MIIRQYDIYPGEGMWSYELWENDQDGNKKRFIMGHMKLQRLQRIANEYRVKAITKAVISKKQLNNF